MQWTFEALDTLFFRDGNPMNAGESGWLQSQFPPTGQTLQGAIRAAILDELGANIKAFQNGEICLENGESLKEEIGDASSIGNLNLTGPFLQKDEQLLLPAPLDLIKNSQDVFSLLVPADAPIECDMGLVRLPEPRKPGSGYKALDGNYLSHQTMEYLLNGDTDQIKPDHLIPLTADKPDDENALTDREPKIGLARNNQTRTNIEGMLFAIAPIRPRAGIKLILDVKGLKKGRLKCGQFAYKLGGEGKLAKISIPEQCQDMKFPSCVLNELAKTIQFKMILTTPGHMQNGGWLPFDCESTENINGWLGGIKNCQLIIVSACIGKPLKIGGWDLKNHRSRPLQSFIPAGSVYFCEAKPDQIENIKALHNSKIGHLTEYGYGHILIGKW